MNQERGWANWGGGRLGGWSSSVGVAAFVSRVKDNEMDVEERCGVEHCICFTEIYSSRREWSARVSSRKRVRIFLQQSTEAMKGFRVEKSLSWKRVVVSELAYHKPIECVNLKTKLIN